MDELVENGEEKADQPLRELSTQVSQQEAAKSELETDAQLDLNSVPLETEETVADNLEKKITSLEHTVAILNTNEATQTSWSDDEEEWCLLSSKAEQSQCLEALLEQVRTKQSQLHRQVQRLCLTGSQQDHFTATDTTRLRGSHTNHLPRQSEEEAGSHRLDNGKGRSMQRTRRLGSPTRAPPACHSPTRHTPVKVAGGTYDSELMRALRERDEMQSMLDKYERHLSEMQANVRVLTTDRDKTRAHYLQAQEEIANLRREVLRSKASRGPKSSVTAQSMLKRLEAERDEARSDLHRMSTERDSLRERLKISQETAISERAHLEQRVEDLQNAVLTLEQERGEQKCRQTQTREATAALEEEVHTLSRKLAASQDNLGRLRNQYNTLRVCHGRTENSLSDANRRLATRTTELQSTQERSRQLEERSESLLKEVVGLKEELSVMQGTLSELGQCRDALQEQLERKSCQLSSANRQLEDKESTMHALKLEIKDLETTTNAVRVMMSGRERELDASRMKVSDLGDELATTLKAQEAMLRETAQLRSGLDRVRLDCQALQLKLDEAGQEKADLERKVQNYMSDTSRIKDLLSSKERECHELQEGRRQASAQAGGWEEQAREAEASAAELRMGLHTSDSERRALKTRVDSLEGSLQEALSAKQSQSAELSQLNHTLQKQKAELQHVEAELRRVEAERSHAQHDLEKMRELCIKLDTSKETVRQELEMWRSEAELVRDQLTSERAAARSLQGLLSDVREKELHRQLGSQEKLTEIQLLRDKLAVADSKASTQGREMVQLKTRSAQLEADLEATRKQLSNERFERERAVHELRRLGLSSSPHSPLLSSTLRSSTSPTRNSLSPHVSWSPERSSLAMPICPPPKSSPNRSVNFKDLYD